LSQQQIVTEIDYYIDGKLVTNFDILKSLKRETKQSINEPLSRYQVRKSIENIYKLGDYSDIEIDAVTISQDSTIKLNFLLKNKIIIKDVQIKGNRNINTDKILSAIKSKPGNEYVESIVKDDLQKIKEIYKKHGYFKAEARITQKKIDEDGKLIIHFFILEGNKANIGSIDFVGNSSISSDYLLKQMKIDKNIEFNYNLLEADIERLKKIYIDYGYITVNIGEPELKYIHKENVVDIKIKIDEGAKIITRFIGEDINSKQLKKQIALYRRNKYSRFILKKSVEDIEAFYKERGFYNAKVDYELQEELPNKVIIRFLIDKGEILTIKEISFEGNHSFTSLELKKKMETKERSYFALLPVLHWFFPKGIFDKYQFENDLRAIKIFYQQHGYQDVKLDHEIKVENDVIYINIKIYEGTQYLIDKVELQGNKNLELDDIQLSAEEGKPFSEELILRDISTLQSFYDKNGYIYANIKPVFQSKNLVYYINEGKKALVGEIKISGNKKTDDSVIEREFKNLDIDKGKTFNLKKLNQCQQRLYALGLFKKVAFNIPGRSESNEILDIKVEVIERNPGTINVSGGYSPSEGIRGTFEIAYNNLGGLARRIGSKLRVGTRGNLYEGRLIEPYFLNTRTRLTIRAFQDNLKETENIKTTGGIINIAKSISLNNNVSLEYKYQDLNSVSQELKTIVSSISIGFNRDTRNHFLSPSRGNLHNVVFEYAGGLLSGETSFAKLTTTNKYFRSIEDNTVLALALRTGYEKGLRSYRKKEIISFERFSAGGSTTVRGYADKSLGPLDELGNHRGDVMLIFNSEIRFPVYKWIRGILFFDSGNVWDKLKFSNIIDSPPKSSMGLGIRVDTPIGPVRIDYGYPFNRVKDKDIPGEFYIALGHAF